MAAFFPLNGGVQCKIKDPFRLKEVFDSKFWSNLPKDAPRRVIILEFSLYVKLPFWETLVKRLVCQQQRHAM